MSNFLHKNCYTARSVGYKYRSFSTNTGDKKSRDTHEDNTFDNKLMDLKQELNSRIGNEVDKIADARDSILAKFNKIDIKIDSMIELYKSVIGLRGNIQQVECKLVEMVEKVDKIELLTAGSVHTNLPSRRSSMRSQPPTIFEAKDSFESTITHI